MDFVFGFVLSVSLCLNAYLYFRLKKAKPIKTQSYEVRQLLADLAVGEALIQMKRVDPASIFLRSPKEYND